MTTSIGYVLAWTYDLAGYNKALEQFKRGKRKQPPTPKLTWTETAEQAESMKARFLAACPRGGVMIEPGPKPKKQARMIVITGVTSAGSTDGVTGDSITAEQDAVVSRVLQRQPELYPQHSRVQIYRMVERGEIEQ